MSDDERVQEFREIISLDDPNGTVDTARLQEYLHLPFPDGHPELRFYNWQLSLGVLPPQRARWEQTWERRESQYFRLISRLFRNCPSFLETGKRGNDELECPDVMIGIQSDVKRMPRIIKELELLVGPDNQYRHLRRMERMIYAFSLSNTRCPYTQGFHELAAPFYCVAVDGARALGMTEDRAESVAFSLLFGLLVGARQYRVFSCLDNHMEMQAMFSRIEVAVMERDSAFADFLFKNMHIQPIHFGFPWVAMLFAQSLDHENLLHLWDHLLIFKEDIVDFTMLVCAAYLLSIKSMLMKLEFDGILTALHNAQGMNILAMLRIAHQLWD